MKEGAHVNEVFDKVNGSDAGLTGREFEACTFLNCSFSGGDLSNCLFVDCRFCDCNLSTVNLSCCGLRNVIFRNCKVAGVDFGRCLPFLFEVNFEKCCLDYSHFIKNRLKKTKFIECTIKEAYFTEVDLTGALFDNCDLLSTVFVRTNLSRADFRTSWNYSINLEKNTVRKAMFSFPGVIGLLSQYDIVVE